MSANLPSVIEAAGEPAELIVRRMVRALDYAEGFWLGFVKSNIADQRCKAIADCRELLEPLKIRLIEIDLKEPITQLLPILKERLAREQGQTVESHAPSSAIDETQSINRQKLAFFIYGLEHSIPSSDAYPPILSHLNLNRELFRQEIPHPLVIWLPDYALTALARRAPDFWAWRSGLYEFAPDPDTAQRTFEPIRSEAWHVTSSLSAQAKRERLALLKGLLADYRELGSSPHERKVQGEILFNIGLVQRDLGELAEAKQAFEESLAIAREQANKIGEASSLHNLGMLAQDTGDYAEARRLYEESLRIERELGDVASEAFSLAQLSLLDEQEGKYKEGVERARQAEEIFLRLGNQGYIDRIRDQRQRLEEKAAENL